MDNSNDEGEESSPSEINERIWNEVLEVAARAAKKTGFLTGESTFGEENKTPEPRWQEFYSSLSEKEMSPAPAKYRSERVAQTLPETAVSNASRGVRSILFSVLLYLWGASSCVMGSAGIMLGTFASNQQYGTVTGLIELALSIVSLIGLVVLLLVRKRPRLSWTSRLIFVLSSSVLGFVSIVASVALTESTHAPGVVSPQEDLALGCVVLIYGLVVATAAFW